ncbi:hypothetical protein BU14_0127s0050 [Porphyra umbilicalis]|uniref:Uncharacterized protein n=1 Tax=Porphyra umbilicalis TaxID=2786 RepID=A0A1X6PBC0_PORUM|nr:hypothetical protein BU14_0127s0050 [Porphyra umbilicalis]|eukprot:OSX77953.1 hypothetical protein BU14_0127s0050 [Porphyra umbilicalis]
MTNTKAAPSHGSPTPPRPHLYKPQPEPRSAPPPRHPPPHDSGSPHDGHLLKSILTCSPHGLHSAWPQEPTRPAPATPCKQNTHVLSTPIRPVAPAAANGRSTDDGRAGGAAGDTNSG